MEALTFLHNDAKLVHSNICPESIIINRNGAWKIAGFDFCTHNMNEADQAVSAIGDASCLDTWPPGLLYYGSVGSKQWMTV